jgi:hypothetical protein
LRFGDFLPVLGLFGPLWASLGLKSFLFNPRLAKMLVLGFSGLHFASTVTDRFRLTVERKTIEIMKSVGD